VREREENHARPTTQPRPPAPALRRSCLARRPMRPAQRRLHGRSGRGGLLARFLMGPRRPSQLRRARARAARHIHRPNEPRGREGRTSNPHQGEPPPPARAGQSPAVRSRKRKPPQDQHAATGRQPAAPAGFPPSGLPPSGTPRQTRNPQRGETLSAGAKHLAPAAKQGATGRATVPGPPRVPTGMRRVGSCGGKPKSLLRTAGDWPARAGAPSPGERHAGREAGS
jgi:hypothetical protein